MRYAVWKRCLDMCVAILLLAITCPLWMLTALLLLLAQGSPVLFRQRRIGYQGCPFTLFKFRTMIDGHPQRHSDRPVGKRPDDQHITPLGRVLRRFALDELPQFVNVLRGEMSLVGPRPLPQDDLEHRGWLEGIHDEERTRREEWAHRRHTVLPGLTGRWQVSRRPEEDFDNWIACDLAYVEQASLREDLRLLAQTPLAVLRGREQYQDDPSRHSAPDGV